MFGHRFPRRIFIGATSNAFPIGKNEPLMKANFPDDVLGHFRASGSELMISYAHSIAGPLTLSLPVALGNFASGAVPRDWCRDHS